jgi:hypothetical protein
VIEMPQPEVAKALQKLEEAWNEIKAIASSETRIEGLKFVEDERIRNKIVNVITGKTISYKYALLSQVLAKVTEPSINTLCLQAGADLPGAFDARSFCKKTVVVFEGTRLEGVLGGSKDPYVSKPLRHMMISPDLRDIKDVQGWMDLYEILKQLEEGYSDVLASHFLKQILVEVFLLQYRILKPPASVPAISLDQLKSILTSYLARPAQGARSQAIVYALLKTLNDRVRAFESIQSAKATTADEFARRIADIECRDASGRLKLAIAVTDELTAAKLDDELSKAIRNNVKDLIIIGHNIREKSKLDEVTDRYKQDIDVAVTSLIDFANLVMVLWNSELRRRFVLKTYEVLREVAYHEHAIEWDRILRKNLGL